MVVDDGNLAQTSATEDELDGVLEPADDEVVIAVRADDGGLAQTSTTMLAQTQQHDTASELQKSVDIWAI